MRKIKSEEESVGREKTAELSLLETIVVSEKGNRRRLTTLEANMLGELLVFEGSESKIGEIIQNWEERGISLEYNHDLLNEERNVI